MRIKVEPFLIKKGNRVAKAAIEFEDGILAGFHMVGFTICEDENKRLSVLLPTSIVRREEGDRPYYFLKPSNEGDLTKLKEAILDIYESMTGRFNTPKLKDPVR